MKIIIRTFALSLLLLGFQAHADKIALEFKGQKQIVEFNPDDKADMERAVNLWRKSDNRKYNVYSENGIFKVYDEPRDDAKFEEIDGWYRELNSMCQQSPEFANLIWDKSKWHPRSCSKNPGWLKLDDPNVITLDQLKPVKEWPIRYMAHYVGPNITEESEGIEPKYDQYRRYQFDREGYLLNNQTLRRWKTKDGNFIRMFHCRDFAQAVAVSPNALDVRLENDGAPVPFSNLKQFLATPKFIYDEDTRGPAVWAGFDDPVKPVYDKDHYNACIIDCKNRKRWEPFSD